MSEGRRANWLRYLDELDHQNWKKPLEMVLRSTSVPPKRLSQAWPRRGSSSCLRVHRPSLALRVFISSGGLLEAKKTMRFRLALHTTESASRTSLHPPGKGLVRPPRPPRGPLLRRPFAAGVFLVRA